jgi:hypothetical protein
MIRWRDLSCHAQSPFWSVMIDWDNEIKDSMFRSQGRNVSICISVYMSTIICYIATIAIHVLWFSGIENEEWNCGARVEWHDKRSRSGCSCCVLLHKHEVSYQFGCFLEIVFFQRLVEVIQISIIDGKSPIVNSEGEDRWFQSNQDHCAEHEYDCDCWLRRTWTREGECRLADPHIILLACTLHVWFHAGHCGPTSDGL